MDNHQFFGSVENAALPLPHFPRDVFAMLRGLSLLEWKKNDKAFTVRFCGRIFSEALDSVPSCKDDLRNNFGLFDTAGRRSKRFKSSAFSANNCVDVMKATKALIHPDHRATWEGSSTVPGMKQIIFTAFAVSRILLERHGMTSESSLEVNSKEVIAVSFFKTIQPTS